LPLGLGGSQSGVVIGFVVAVVLVGPVQERRAPDPKAVERAVERVEEALEAGDADGAVAAIGEASEVVDAAVVAAIARGMRSRDREVREAVVGALRWMDHPDALGVLHRTLERDRALRKDAELAAAVVKAIGQHANASSIPFLAEGAFKTPEREAIRARILGLGRIRDVAAVEALMRMMKTTPQRDVDRHMEDFRLALLVLTGTDQGPTSRRWLEWWDDERDGFRVTEELPSLPREVERKWNQYWGLEHGYGRAPRREDRGDRGGRDDAPRAP